MPVNAYKSFKWHELKKTQQKHSFATEKQIEREQMRELRLNEIVRVFEFTNRIEQFQEKQKRMLEPRSQQINTKKKKIRSFSDEE